jgi:transcriptional regulator with XRE-family HTH domain
MDPRKWIRSTGTSQAAVAAQLGVKLRTLSRYLNGLSTWPLDLAFQLCALTGWRVAPLDLIVDGRTKALIEDFERQAPVQRARRPRP